METIVSKVRSMPFKRKMREEYGSLQTARHLSYFLQKVAESGLTLQASWDARSEFLGSQGYETYKDYITSEFWAATRRRYKDSGLLGACLLCGSPDYLLHHTDYSTKNIENIFTFLPMCDSHHRKLHLFLAEHGIPLEFSFDCLRASQAANSDWGRFNRSLWPYRQAMLRVRLAELGLTCEISGARVGDKQTKKRDSKTIRVRGDRGFFASFSVQVSRGTVALSYNGKKVSFEEFCAALPTIIRKKQNG